MRKIYSVAKFFLIFSSLIIGFKLPGQTIQYLNSNNIIGGIAIGGNLFSDTTMQNINSWKTNLFQTKFDSNRSEIFTAALWITCMDTNGGLHCAANRYYDYGVDFFNGPVAATYDSIYDRYYKRVWKVTQTQITHFRSLSFPVSAILIDSAILYWPGRGNPNVLSDYGVNITSPLAPFVDLNNNGIYEPTLGDYPGICGDQGIFFVFNDARGAHTQTHGNPIGVEVRGMANSFTDLTGTMVYGKRAVNNAVFVQYEIENKSANNYSLLDFGPWLDPDIGCFDNDYIACDTTRNLMLAYNGTKSDPSCLPEYGYDTLYVALGVKLLNQPMNVFGGFGANGNMDTATNDPVYATEYRRLEEGYWANGLPFTYGGNGYGGSLSDSTKYLFTGGPNDSAAWSEPTAVIIPGDQRMYCSTNHLGFNMGDVKHFDYAFFTSYDSTSDYLSIVDTVRRDADIIQSFYNNTILPCQAQFATAIKAIEPEIQVSIYPNPATDQVTIVAGEANIKSLELLDIQGRILLTKTVGAKTIILPVTGLAKGIYLLNIQCASGSVVKRIAVE